MMIQIRNIPTFFFWLVLECNAINFFTPSLSSIDLNTWWGSEELKTNNDTSIKPFKIVFHDEMIEDLRHRLLNYRPPPPPLEGVGFEYGFNTRILKDWIQYWANVYPFKERELYLNQYPQFKTNIQGLDIHFIRVVPKVQPGQDVVPLLLLHGWPGSVREFYSTIPYLTSTSKRRDFALEVIVPSLPGFGYSDAAVRPQLGASEIAVVLRNLMHRLGYKRFYVQGGDWGAIIGSYMATIFPDEVLGYHTNLATSFTPKALGMLIVGNYIPSAVVEPHLTNRLYPLMQYLLWLLRESGYFHLQTTKPDSLGVAMTDSPAGLLAYILQIFSTGTRKEYINRVDGGLDINYTREELIDNLMMYWVPNSITTSFRIYAETVNLKSFRERIYEIPTLVPTCTIHAKDEILYQSPVMLRTKYSNLLNSTVLEDGGHFLAMEMPNLFAEDVLESIKMFREWHEKERGSSQSDSRWSSWFGSWT